MHWHHIDRTSKLFMLWCLTTLTKRHPWTCPTPEPVFHIFPLFTHVWACDSVFLCDYFCVRLCDSFGLGQRLQDRLSHLAVCESAYVCAKLRALLAGSLPWSSHSDKTDPTIASSNTGSHCHAPNTNIHSHVTADRNAHTPMS